MNNNIEKVLCIDIGGSHIKEMVVNLHGECLQKYEREKTPVPSSPEMVLEVIKKISSRFPEYDKISAGFPGYIKNGVVMTAPKLGNEYWNNFPLEESLAELLGKPAKVINDADFQALTLAEGKGLEMVITLGTGFGSALMKDGHLLPHLEMSLHPFTKKQTYNDYIGEDALKKKGKKKWNKRMKKVIDVLKTVFNYDHLYISGGNAEYINFQLDNNISIESNQDGIKGGAVLWK
jgi:polyphosphate glucokinase